MPPTATRQHTSASTSVYSSVPNASMRRCVRAVAPVVKKSTMMFARLNCV